MVKEYIEREALLDKSYAITEATIDNPYGGKSVVDVEDIENAPAADVVEVVRCRERKHITPVEGGLPLCTLHNTAVAYNDFCSYGERKDGADNAAD